MSDNKFLAITIGGLLLIGAGLVIDSIYKTNETNKLIKYAIDKGANVTLSKNGSK
jgi:hypothetical protein